MGREIPYIKMMKSVVLKKKIFRHIWEELRSKQTLH